MRRLSTLLAEELLRLPDVGARPMFGMRALYRGTAIFALLPDKRSLESASTIAYKLRGAAEGSGGGKWQPLELRGEQDIAKALSYLDRAYNAAAPAQGAGGGSVKPTADSMRPSASKRK